MCSRSDFSVGTILLALLVTGPVFSTTYHVAKTGNDGNAGSSSLPFLTINKAAQILQPGDSVIVHAGEYREWVQPARGGSSENTRIVYKAAPGEIAHIKGSERVTAWASQGNGVWKVDLNDSFFGSYNPFRYDIRGRWTSVTGGEGDQYIDGGQWCHLGEVFLDGQIYLERQTFNEVQSTQKTWYTSRSGTTQSIYANFGTSNPNLQLAEINVREGVFGNPNVTSGINYLTVDGFWMSQSADAWTPPYISSPLVSFAVIFTTGTHMIIQNCTIKFGKMRGICLDGGPGYKYDIVRNNVITECGIDGIAGRYADGDAMIGNWIDLIHGQRSYYGDEHGCIKLNYCRDNLIAGNMLLRINSPTWAVGLKLDWPNNPGNRITGNAMIDATLHTFESYHTNGGANHILDNNIFIGPVPYEDGSCTYIHNLYYCGESGGESNDGSNNLVLSNQTNLYSIDTAAKTVTLSFTVSSSVANQNNPIVTSGSTTINKDFYQFCRPAREAKSGPFQNLKAGLNTFVLRPNSDFSLNAPCQSTSVRRAPTIAGVSGIRILADALSIAGEGKTVVRIVNARGQLVRVGKLAGDGRVGLGDLAPGVYQASIRSAAGTRAVTIAR